MDKWQACYTKSEKQYFLSFEDHALKLKNGQLWLDLKFVNQSERRKKAASSLISWQTLDSQSQFLIERHVFRMT